MKYKGKPHTVASRLTALQHQCALPQETQEAASQSSYLVLSCNNLQEQHYLGNKIKFKKRKKSSRQNPFKKKKVCKLNQAEHLF